MGVESSENSVSCCVLNFVKVIGLFVEFRDLLSPITDREFKLFPGILDKINISRF